MTRPTARFVRPAAGTRERRLGLGSLTDGPAARPDPAALGRGDLGPFDRLRARWRAFVTPVARRRSMAPLRPSAPMTWSRPTKSGLARRTGSAPAAWHD